MRGYYLILLGFFANTLHGFANSELPNCDLSNLTLLRDYPYLCLPEQIDENITQQMGVLAYEIPENLPKGASIPNIAKGPITLYPDEGSTYFINGVSVFNSNEIREFFTHDHFAFLPKNSAIKVNSKVKGEINSEVWEYPNGTRLFHKISYIQKDTRKIFELRVTEKLSNGLWAFGIYAPSESGPLLNLVKDDQKKVSIDAEIKLESEGMKVGNFQLKRLNPLGCRDCHVAHSAVAYPTGNTDASHSDAAGPCGFAPTNKLISDEADENSWARRFQSQFGYWPFEE